MLANTREQATMAESSALCEEHANDSYSRPVNCDLGGVSVNSQMAPMAKIRMGTLSVIPGKYQTPRKGAQWQLNKH